MARYIDADDDTTIKKGKNMNYKIKVNNKFLVGESMTETIKGTVSGDTTAVFSRVVGEMSAYDFCDNINDATEFDRVTVCDYLRGIMERQNCGLYLGEIKLIDSEAEETVAHCNVEENARIISHIMEFDELYKKYDWYDQHIQHATEKEVSVPKWISVEERLPEDYSRVLGFMAWGGMMLLERQSKGWYLADRIQQAPDEAVLYWMPLPAPPKGVE